MVPPALEGGARPMAANSFQLMSLHSHASTRRFYASRPVGTA